ncbi:uncharacterized protein BROUX77_005579 [Berkeleyomyces rouxiae]|uniref:uncharacterized protein n=1 Tax=Berkeleyomyces rouxiae TaxID=2035830 RepID=UPI003B7BBF95
MSNPAVPGPSNPGLSMQDLFQALQAMREDNERAQLQLREEFSRAQQQRDQEIANLQAFACVATASPALVTPSVPVATADGYVKRPKPKIPDIPLFSGKRAEYLVWAMYARQKIAPDGPAIGDDGDQYTYLFARMATEAQKLVAVYFQRGLSQGYTAARFLDHLDTIFIDKMTRGVANKTNQEVIPSGVNVSETQPVRAEESSGNSATFPEPQGSGSTDVHTELVSDPSLSPASEFSEEEEEDVARVPREKSVEPESRGVPSSTSDEEPPTWAKLWMAHTAEQQRKAEERHRVTLKEMTKAMIQNQEANSRPKIPKTPPYSVQKLKKDATLGEVED